MVFWDGDGDGAASMIFWDGDGDGAASISTPEERQGSLAFDLPEQDELGSAVVGLHDASTSSAP